MDKSKNNPIFRKNRWSILISFIVLYGLLHTIIFRDQPLIGDDGLLSTLSSYQNLVLDIEEGSLILHENSYAHSLRGQGWFVSNHEPVVSYLKGKELISLFHQYRKGGLPYYFLGKISRIFDPVDTYVNIHLLINLLSLLFIGFLLFKITDPEIAFLTLIFYVLDPINILAQGPSVSESFLRLIVSMILFFLFSDKKWMHILSGFFICLAVYIKVTSLFYLPCFGLLLYSQKEKVNLKFLLSGLVIGGFLYLAIADYSMLWAEINQQHRLGNLPYLLKDFINMFVHKRNFLYLFTEERYVSLLRESPWAFFKLQWPHLLLVLTFLIPFFAQISSQARKVFQVKFYLKVYAALLLFALSVFLPIHTLFYFPKYLAGIAPLVSFILARICRDMWVIFESKFSTKRMDILFMSLFVLPILYNSIDFYIYYQNQGPISIFNADLAQKITADLERNQILSPYVLGEEEQGRWEFLSQERITPFNLSKIIRKGKYQTFASLLKSLKSGDVLVPINDQFSSWFWKWGHHLDPEITIKKLESEGITITHYHVYHHHSVPKAWRFKFHLN